jgi:hypothetical protein
MDQPDHRSPPARSPFDTMRASQADIKAGRVDDLDVYLERISREIDDAMADAQQRQRSATP